jgi:hypothetical protein
MICSQKSPFQNILPGEFFILFMSFVDTVLNAPIIFYFPK